MKHCHGCDKDLPESDFGKHKTKYDGLQSQCKNCRRITNNEQYANNPVRRATIKRNKQKNRNEVREFVRQTKLESSCKVCEESEPCTLDFHHLVEDEKSFSIANAGGNVSIATLKLEIEKCVVICSNCHRKVHAGIVKL